MQSQGSERPPPDLRAALVVAGSRGATRAVVLVLNGGKSVSHEASMSTQLSVLRMLPFAWAIRRRTRSGGVAVWRLHYRYQGWNGLEASPVPDANWALAEVRRLHGDVPVVLVGHSMGGRTAARVAGDPLVCGLVLLAPWLESGDPVPPRDGLPICILHGDQDRITSAASAAAWGERARRAGAAVSILLIPGGEHFMLRRFRSWHRLATEAVVADLRDALPGDDGNVVLLQEIRARSGSERRSLRGRHRAMP